MKTASSPVAPEIGRRLSLPESAPERVPPSLRPEITAGLMRETGLDSEMLHRLVHRFYDRVRRDALLGPIFAARIADWAPHLRQMEQFWHSVALMTGSYKGAPMPAHVDLPVEWRHFEQWLALFRATAQEVCPPEGAAHVIARAERIARALHMAIEDKRALSADPKAPPRL